MVDLAGIRSKKIQAADRECSLSCQLSIGIGLMGLVLSLAAPSQASELMAKPDPINKSTLRFQQTYFEHQRLEQQAIRERQQQDQTRFDQLRARLLPPRPQSSQHPSPQLPMEHADIDNAPIQSAPIQDEPISTESNPIVSIPARGTYLYGQQPIANQPGTTYFVFETRGIELTGALYMPFSSFDCVQGQIKQEQIALDVIDSYSQERFSHALPLSPPFAQIANRTGTVAIPPAIEGFYSLPVQESDRTLLATCQII